MITTVAFDHGTREISESLYDWCHKLQREPGLGYSDAYGGFHIASRHADICAIVKDTENFSSAQGITIPPLTNPVPSIPAESDEPMHRHYRTALQNYLTPAAVRGYASDIHALVTQAIDGFIEKGEADLVADLAAQIPTMATAQVFGFDKENAIKFDRGFRGVVEAAGGSVEVQMRVVGDFMAFLKEVIDARRAAPADDIISAIVTFEVSGRKFTEEECLGLLYSVAGAASDTTRNAIGHTLYHVHEAPGIRQRILDDPSVIPAVVEECLRLEAPAFMIARVAVRDVIISGTPLKPGDRVLLAYGWANRDQSVFDNPDELAIDRPNVMQHCTFGKGIHTCIGMHLARLELRVVLEQLMRRLPDYRLTAKPEGPRLAGGLMWGFESLPVAFTPGPVHGSTS